MNSKNSSLVLFIISISLLGALLNNIAITNNRGYMPVKLEAGYLMTDSKHFAYSDFSEVNHWYLTDIIPIGIGIISIGDVLLLAALVLAIANAFIHIRKLYIRRWIG